MTDDSVQEKDALATVWPDAIQYLCHFHVGQAEWRWLCEGKNQVDIDERQSFIRLFQQVRCKSHSKLILYFFSNPPIYFLLFVIFFTVDNVCS